MTYEEILKIYQQKNAELLCEPPAYLFQKEQGDYTIEDWEQLPDDLRVELIDGVFIYMAEPSTDHQRMLVMLTVALEFHIRSNKGTCRTYVAPCGVQLNADDKHTILEPDIFVICDKNKDIHKRIVGAPDLVIEILSPTTRKKDLGIKKKKYQEAGVREYWTIDLQEKIVTVHLFSMEQIQLYTLEDMIPISIFETDCIIDMKEIMGRIEL